MTVNVFAIESTNSENQGIILQNINGVSRNFDDENIVETAEDLNFNLDEIVLQTNQNMLNLKVNMNQEQIEFNLNLYPSQFGGVNSENKIIGISNEPSSNYEILRFSIEKDANTFSLLQPNYHLENKTVVSLGFYDTQSLEKYYFEFELSNFDFNEEYKLISSLYDENVVSKEEIMDIEVAYFVMEPLSHVEAFGESIDENMSHSEKIGSSSVKSNIKSKDFDISGNNLTQLIENQEIINLKNRDLISGIDDIIYETKKNGEFSKDVEQDDWDFQGYFVYHMYDSISGNAMNYVLKYFVVNNFDLTSAPR